MSYLNIQEVKNIIKEALKEDIGRGDITTALSIPKNIKIKADIIAHENGVVCGLQVAREVFNSQGKDVKFVALVKDGDRIKKDKALARIYGKAAGILIAERVALNFLSLLSGIATKTKEYVEAVRPYKVRILDTRKTLPGLRKLEKYAVRVGGGCNHRNSLDEMVLLKDNHLKVVGDRLWDKGFQQIKNKISGKIKIEIEVNTLEEFKKALKIRPDIIMLDNMALKDIKKAVRLKDGSLPKLEVSGGIDFKNIRNIAATGIDFISLGTLTKDIEALDLSLEIK